MHMLETSNINTITSHPIIASATNLISLPVSSPTDPTPRSEIRPRFQPIQSKIIDDLQNDDVHIDIENDVPQDYFKPDPVQEEEKSDHEIVEKPHTKKDEQAYEAFFKPAVFFKFLLMHLLFFCVFGPFITLLSPIFGFYVLKNQGFTPRCDIDFIQQTLQYILILSFLLTYYLTDTPGLQGIEVYMILIAVLVRMVTISSKYSYSSEWLIKLTHTTFISGKDRQSDLMIFRWRHQTDDVINEEIQSAILRLEVDSPLFFFNFLCDIDQELKNKLSKHNEVKKMSYLQPPTNDPSLNNSEEAILPLTRPTSQEQPSSRFKNIVEKHQKKNAWNFASPRKESNSKPESPLSSPQGQNTPSESGRSTKKKVVNQSTRKIFDAFVDFLRPQKLEEKYLYGYSLLVDMLTNARKKQFKSSGILSIVLSVIRAMMPTLYRVYLIHVKGENIATFTDKPYITGGIFITNTLFFWVNCVLLIIAVQNIKTKVYCFKQIGYLLSPKKLSYYKERKLYPTLNIFDPVSLKTWSSMRKIVRDYGRKYVQRNNLNIGISMALYTFVLVTFVLQILGVFTAFNDPLILIVLGFESLILFVIFIQVMLGSAFLNKQYQVHKNLLKKNKTIITDLQRLSHLYVGKDAIKPDNTIYKEGLRILRKELGEEDFENKLIERAEKLSAMIDDIIEELDFEEINEPFRVMGIVVNDELLKSLALGGVSLIFAMVQSFVN